MAKKIQKSVKKTEKKIVKPPVEKKTKSNVKLVEIARGGAVTKDVTEELDLIVEKFKNILSDAGEAIPDNMYDIFKAIATVADKGLHNLKSKKELAIKAISDKATHLTDKKLLSRLVDLNMTPKQAVHIIDEDISLSNEDMWRVLRKRLGE